MFENHNQCIVCCAKANQVCSGCREVHYCTKDHQKLHWSTHKKTCPSFKIVTKSKYGRLVMIFAEIVFLFSLITMDDDDIQVHDCIPQYWPR